MTDRIRSSYEHMMQRCHNPNDIKYPRYGARGISVCDEWRGQPKVFIRYVREHLGEPPVGYTLNRINNNDGYRPGNIEWADATQQCINRDYPVGQHGYKWVETTRNGYRGVFHYYKRKYRTRKASTPLDAYCLVLALRLETLWKLR